jgi:hypothetical protein
MFRMLLELCGLEITALDGRLGELDDLYVDGDCWQVRYLVLSLDDGLDEAQVLLSTGCVRQVRPHGPISVELSRTQLASGAGAWPVHAAAAWLDGRRVWSGCDLVGFRVDAEDGTAGRVADLLVDDEEWSVDYLVMEVAQAGGNHRLLLPLDWVDAFDRPRRSVRVRRTRDELHKSPRLDD